MIVSQHLKVPMLVLQLFAAGMLLPAVADAGEVRVFPQKIDLSSAQDRQRVIVQQAFDNGITRDVTAKAVFESADQGIVRCEGNVVLPVGDGSTELTVTIDGERLSVPIRVRDAALSRPVSFRLDVMPVLTKGGCNKAGCHGSAGGQDGFGLSLFGSDPATDYKTLTRQWIGRRVKRSIPDESLLLTKATGEVPHTGGVKIEHDSDEYQALLRWVAAGAQYDTTSVPKVDSIQIYPERVVLEGPGAKQPLCIRAYYSDGTDRDVTSLCTFETTNKESAGVEAGEMIVAQKTGESFITARFDTHTVGLPIVVLADDEEFTWDPPAAHNYIDSAVFDKLMRLRITPAAICDDEAFLRRVTLDLCGRLPTVEEYRAFVESTNPKKRSERIDALIASDAFSDIWTMRWADLLQVRTGPGLSKKAINSYFTWLHTQIANRVPLDEMVHQLIAAGGGTFANAPCNYYETEKEVKKISENMAQVFLGMRLQCCACHNHPFDRWTQDDYYNFAAFFAQLGRKAGEDPRETIIFNAGKGEMRHPLDDRIMEPKFLGGDQPEVHDRDRREVLADWVTSPENPFFARHMANLIWDHFFHRGIVDDPDDARVSNPPVNPELLTALEAKLKEYQFQVRPLVRDICNSRTYQVATVSGRSSGADFDNFSRAKLRRMRAAVLLDAISQVTETDDKFETVLPGTRAVQIPDGSVATPFLSTFGRSPRKTVCTCEVKMEPNLSQALHLLNGDTVHTKIAAGGLIARRLEEKKSIADVIDELYIRCLSRTPGAGEKESLLKMVSEYENPQEGLSDVFWSLLNSKEFLFIH